MVTLVHYTDERKYFFLLALILLLSLALRMYNLDKFSLSYDESIIVLDEWGFDKLPSLHNLFDRNYLINNQDFLTLYSHGFVYYWQRLFGKSEFSLRLSSVIFSVVGVLFVFLLARKFLNTRIALLASFLLAISPLHIYYAQELRPYSAVSLLMILSIFSLLQVIVHKRKRFWIPFTLLNILSIYFHYMSALLLASILLFYIFDIKNTMFSWKHLVASYLIAFICAFPVFVSLLPHVRFFMHQRIPVEINEFPVWAGAKIRAINLLFTLKNFSAGYHIDYYSSVGKFITFLSAMLFFYGVYLFRKKKELKLFLVCLLFPIVLLFLISQFKTCYVDRYFFFSLPFYLIIISVALSTLNKKVLLPLILLITLCAFIGIRKYYANDLPAQYEQHAGEIEKEDMSKLIKELIGNYKSGDGIVHIDKSTVFPAKLYVRLKSNNSDLINEINRGVVIFVLPDNEIRTFEYKHFHPYAVLPDMSVSFKDLIEKKRVWLIFPSSGNEFMPGKRYQIMGRINKIIRNKEMFGFDNNRILLFTQEKESH